MSKQPQARMIDLRFHKAESFVLRKYKPRFLIKDTIGEEGNLDNPNFCTEYLTHLR